MEEKRSLTARQGLLLGIAIGVIAGVAAAVAVLGRDEGEASHPSPRPPTASPVGEPSRLPAELVKPQLLQPARSRHIATAAATRAGPSALKTETVRRDSAVLRKDIEASVKGLASADASVRLESVRALRRLRAKEEAPRVRALLGDPNPAVRRAAATTAGYFSDSEAFEDVLRLARKDKDSSVRAAAISSLITTGGRKHARTAAILAENLTSPDPHVRLAAVTAMNLLDWSLVDEKEKAVLRDLAANDGLYQEMGEERMYPVRDAARTLLLAHGIKVGGE